MPENRPFSRKITIFGNFGPLGANKDIKFFYKLFDFFKAHTQKATVGSLPYQYSNFNCFTPPYCGCMPPNLHVYGLFYVGLLGISEGAGDGQRQVRDVPGENCALSK